MPTALVVEDEARNTALLDAILVLAGYRMVAVDNLAEARSRLQSGDAQPDVVLLDRHLGDGDGLDLARWIRSSGPRPGVPIILVSASVLPTDQDEAIAAGCDAFVPKPIRVDPLIEQIRALVPAEA